MRELAQQAGTTIEFARTFWRAMGFPVVSDDQPNFASDDVEALAAWAAAVEAGTVDRDTMVSLIRAQSYNMDRLALWQMEAIVARIQRRDGVDDTTARAYVLEHMSEYDSFVSAQLAYTWRRQMEWLAERVDNEIHARTEHDLHDVLPLPRALGFADMVSFTSTARQLGSRELTELVQGFEFTARDVITTNGARVVKMVGDAVLYIADDVVTAARVGLALIEAVRTNPQLLPVRASLVWGRIVSRSGDVFGPAVNLASRLIDVAPRDCLYTDESTAALLAKSPYAADFLQLLRDPVDLEGIGELSPVELKWSDPALMESLWLPD